MIKITLMDISEAEFNCLLASMKCPLKITHQGQDFVRYIDQEQPSELFLYTNPKEKIFKYGQIPKGYNFKFLKKES